MKAAEPKTPRSSQFNFGLPTSASLIARSETHKGVSTFNKQVLLYCVIYSIRPLSPLNPLLAYLPHQASQGVTHQMERQMLILLQNPGSPDF